MKLFSINKYLLAIFLIFLFLSCYKILIPFADEPDFEIRIQRISNNHFNLINFDELDVSPHCLNESKIGRESIFASFNYKCIQENLENYFLERLSYPILISIILFSLLFAISILIKDNFLCVEKYLISFLCPFNIYILGNYSDELLSFGVSLLIFCFDNKYVKFLLICLLFIIDYDGQFIIVSLFLLINFFTKNFIENRNFTYLLLITFLITSFFNNYLNELLLFISPSFYADKISTMLSANIEYRDKYSLFERLLICILSLVFMTANGIKVYLQYLYAIFHLKKFIFICKLLKNEIKIFLFTLVVFIGFFPTHSYGKYYIFIFPYLISKIIKIYNFNQLLDFSIKINLLVILNLAIYYIL